MENVTISVPNECWESIVLAWQRGGGPKVQRIRNPPACWDKEEGMKQGARRRQIEMRLVPALITEGLNLYGPALFLSFYLLDMGSG